jgi:hypothetical protein
MSSVTGATLLGQAHKVSAAVEAEHVGPENHHVKVIEVAAMLDIHHGSACHIIHNVLQLHIV